MLNNYTYFGSYLLYFIIIVLFCFDLFYLISYFIISKKLQIDYKTVIRHYLSGHGH